jgi:hypothetical protein
MRPRRVIKYFDKDKRKHDYVKSISTKTGRGLEWFSPSQRVIGLHQILLYYAVKKLVASDKLQVATYIAKRITL